MDKHERRALQLERRADLLDKVPSEKKTLSDKKWRPSHFASINPRSATYVREDAPLKERLGYPIAGNAAGAAIAGPVGQMAGASIGRSRNLSRDYVRAYNKRSGRPAESFTGVGLDGFYDYPSSDKLRAKAAKQRSKIKKSVGSMSAFGIEHEPVSKMGAKFNSEVIRHLNKRPHYRLRAGETTTSPDGLQATTRFSVQGKTNKGRRKLRRLDGDSTGTITSPVAGDNKLGQRGLMSVAVPKGTSEKVKRKLGFETWRSADPDMFAVPVTRKKKRYKIGY